MAISKIQVFIIYMCAASHCPTVRERIKFLFFFTKFPSWNHCIWLLDFLFVKMLIFTCLSHLKNQKNIYIWKRNFNCLVFKNILVWKEHLAEFCFLRKFTYQSLILYFPMIYRINNVYRSRIITWLGIQYWYSPINNQWGSTSNAAIPNVRTPFSMNQNQPYFMGFQMEVRTTPPRTNYLPTDLHNCFLMVQNQE